MRPHKYAMTHLCVCGWATARKMVSIFVHPHCVLLPGCALCVLRILPPSLGPHSLPASAHQCRRQTPNMQRLHSVHSHHAK